MVPFLSTVKHRNGSSRQSSANPDNDMHIKLGPGDDRTI